MFSFTARSLPAYPQVIGGVSARWKDAQGREHDAGHLDDVAAAYTARSTAMAYFGGKLEGRADSHLSCWPGAPRPRAQVSVRGEPQEVDDIIALVKKAFPLPFEGALIFLSWGGPLSGRVATELQPLLESHLPAANVFLSSTSIEPGDDPMRKMIEDGLQKASALIAVLTKDAAARPWVIWETASVFARGKLVIPIFVDVEPHEVPGPLTTKAQGVHLARLDKLNSATATIAMRLGLRAPFPITEEEHRRVLAVLRCCA